MKIKKIIRSRRKTIALQVCDDATLIVRAPIGVRDDVIQKMIARHHQWLEKKGKEILSRDLNITKREYINGETLLYLGKYFRLKVVKSDEVDDKITLKDGYFYLRGDIIKPREAFVDWYRKEAYQKIFERVGWYGERQGFQYKQVKISNARKRWGSCSHLGNLNFSWRLIMAPMPVIDYVVVHELVHLIERNHSRSFWNKVSHIMPDYRKHRSWLKKNGYLLNL